MASRSPVREALAAEFLAALEKQQLPWEAGWAVARPVNAATGIRYRGINHAWLSFVAKQNGWEDSRWCTYKQAQEKGWQVHSGEHGTKVEFYSLYDTRRKRNITNEEARKLKEQDAEYTHDIRVNIKIYTVFNAAQIDGMPAQQEVRTDIGALRQQRDILLHNLGVGFQEGGNEAYYLPDQDIVVLPPEGAFFDPYGYMATLLHECGHASGHSTRLNRDLSGSFGSEAYAREELRAEIASAFLSQELGFSGNDALHRQSHIAYIQSWIATLKKDPGELMKAINAAERISDYLMEKGEFQKAMEEQPVYYHFYYQGEYLFTLSGEEQAQAVYDRLCNDTCAMGYSWSDGGKSYRSDAPEAPVSDRAGSDQTVTASRPFSEALYEEHIAHLMLLCKAADRQNAAPDLTSPRDAMALAPKYPWANRDQLAEIAAGIRGGLAPELRSLYAKPEFSALQMNCIRYAISRGLPLENVVVLADPAFNATQMDIIKAGFEAGMSYEQVRAFAKPEIPAQQMLDTVFEFCGGDPWPPKPAMEAGIDSEQAACRQRDAAPEL